MDDDYREEKAISWTTTKCYVLSSHQEKFDRKSIEMVLLNVMYWVGSHWEKFDRKSLEIVHFEFLRCYRKVLQNYNLKILRKIQWTKK